MRFIALLLTAGCVVVSSVLIQLFSVSIKWSCIFYYYSFLDFYILLKIVFYVILFWSAPLSIAISGAIQMSYCDCDETIII